MCRGGIESALPSGEENLSGASAAMPNTGQRTADCSRANIVWSRPVAGTTQNEEGRLSAAFVAYFSLISRRRSSRKPWAVIGSG